MRCSCLQTKPLASPRFSLRYRYLTGKIAAVLTDPLTLRRGGPKNRSNARLLITCVTAEAGSDRDLSPMHIRRRTCAVEHSSRLGLGYHPGGISDGGTPLHHSAHVPCACQDGDPGRWMAIRLMVRTRRRLHRRLHRPRSPPTTRGQ